MCGLEEEHRTVSLVCSLHDWCTVVVLCLYMLTVSYLLFVKKSFKIITHVLYSSSQKHAVFGSIPPGECLLFSQSHFSTVNESPNTEKVTQHSQWKGNSKSYC